MVLAHLSNSDIHLGLASRGQGPRNTLFLGVLQLSIHFKGWSLELNQPFLLIDLIKTS